MYSLHIHSVYVHVTRISILLAIHGSTTRADENTYYDYDKEQKIPTYLLWDYLIEAYADKYEKMYQEFQVRALCVRNYVMN